jgi:hypothetical protein
VIESLGEDLNRYENSFIRFNLFNVLQIWALNICQLELI